MAERNTARVSGIQWNRPPAYRFRSVGPALLERGSMCGRGAVVVGQERREGDGPRLLPEAGPGHVGHDGEDPGAERARPSQRRSPRSTAIHASWVMSSATASLRT